MKVAPFARFVCPLDGAPLLAGDGGFGCEQGHRYDRAREGYVNLLPVQHKASRDPGDDKAMVAARRRIADCGVFQPLSDALFDWLRAYAQTHEAARALSVVDAGCGEGYTLAELASRAARCDDALSLELAGYDISKWAVRAAARRGATVAWAVASNRQPPLPPASVDVMLSLFGFPHWPSFAALLAIDGRLVTVDADADHLLELREVIYPEVLRSAPVPAPEAVAGGWHISREQHIGYRMDFISAQAIADLVSMTPHAHRMSADGRAALAGCKELSVGLSMVMREWRPPQRVGTAAAARE